MRAGETSAWHLYSRLLTSDIKLLHSPPVGFERTRGWVHETSKWPYAILHERGWDAAYRKPIETAIWVKNFPESTSLPPNGPCFVPRESLAPLPDGFIMGSASACDLWVLKPRLTERLVEFQLAFLERFFQECHHFIQNRPRRSNELFVHDSKVSIWIISAETEASVNITQVEGYAFFQDGWYSEWKLHFLHGRHCVQGVAHDVNDEPIVA